MVAVGAPIRLFAVTQILKHTPQVVFEGGHLLRTEALVEEPRHLPRNPVVLVPEQPVPLGEGDEGDPPVVGAGLPAQVACLLEAVEHAGEGGLAELGCLGELSDGDAVRLPEDEEDASLGGVEPYAMFLEEPVRARARYVSTSSAMVNAYTTGQFLIGFRALNREFRASSLPEL